MVYAFWLPRGRGRACPARGFPISARLPCKKLSRKMRCCGKLAGDQWSPLHLSNILPCGNGKRPRNGQGRSLQSTCEPHL